MNGLQGFTRAGEGDTRGFDLAFSGFHRVPARGNVEGTLAPNPLSFMRDVLGSICQGVLEVFLKNRVSTYIRESVLSGKQPLPRTDHLVTVLGCRL